MAVAVLVVAVLAVAVLASPAESLAAPGRAGSRAGADLVRSAAAPDAVLPVATLRSRYLAIVAPADRAFAGFQPKLETLTAAVSPSRLRAALRPVAGAIARAGRELYALRREAPVRIARDLVAVVSGDNVVWQGLEDLGRSWGSRSFDLAGWQGAFAAAVRRADASAASLRHALGIRP